MPEEKEPPALQPMLSLPLAANLVYAGATGQRTNDLDTLNNVARLIASRARIFSREQGQTDMLMPDELLEGHFEEGGALLRFKDQRRAPIRELAILTADLGALVEEIRQLYGRGGG
jgi:hypothetical protein